MKRSPVLAFLGLTFLLGGFASLIPCLQASPPLSESRKGEMRGGLLIHDINGHFKRGHERGVMLNGEYLFSALNQQTLSTIVTLHPYAGGSLNVTKQGSPGTSFVYGGLTAHFPTTTLFFAEVGLGGALHNGRITRKSRHKKNYGSRFLVHSTLTLGIQLDADYALMLNLQHISNAGLTTPNPGATDFGVRLGYRF